ncbi:sensor histidine kinase [Paenibacillus sp. GCM10027626]|uniref:sensor histidine kinase n=1 Tax=Paenibacillus sp. GCM10027626 TaxID=3273411 RepID=UPI00362D26F8
MEPAKQSRFKLTIFAQLIAAFLLVIAPIYGIGLLMNLMGESVVKEELSKSLESRVDFYLHSLEIETEHMFGMLQEYVVDEDLQHLTFLYGIMTLSEWSDTVRSIQNKLRVIKSSNHYVKSVEAHVLTLGRTLSSERSIADAIDPEYEAAKLMLDETGSGIYYAGERMFIGISYPSPPVFQQQPGFVLAIEVNGDAIRDVLQAFSDYGHSGAALFNIGQKRVLTHDSQAAIVPVMQTYVQEERAAGRTSGVKTLRAAGESYLVSYRYSPPLDSYLAAYIPSEQMLKPIDTYKNLLWLMSLASLAIVILYSNWIYRRIHMPIRTMVRAFRKVEQGQLEPIGSPRRNDEFRYLFNRFNLMTERLKMLIDEVYEQKIRSQSSELKQLQAQINPHFLYNTYFILYRLAQENDNDSIMLFSQYLGEYFRYITRSGSDEATLEQEVQHARTYTEIQNIRFMNRIAVDFGELPEACREASIPRLVLQPLIENAYKYGMERKRKGGRIRIRIGRENETGAIVLTVEDNGDQLTEEILRKLAADFASSSVREMEYTGLLNVHRRLQIRFGERCGLTVARSEWGGMKVAMTIPGRDGDVSSADRR